MEDPTEGTGVGESDLTGGRERYGGLVKETESKDSRTMDCSTARKKFTFRVVPNTIDKEIGVLDHRTHRVSPTNYTQFTYIFPK